MVFEGSLNEFSLYDFQDHPQLLSTASIRRLSVISLPTLLPLPLAVRGVVFCEATVDGFFLVVSAWSACKYEERNNGSQHKTN
jgi:uncharacterized membrane protein